MRYHDRSDQWIRRHRARAARRLGHPNAGLPEGRLNKNRWLGCAPHTCPYCRAGKEFDIPRPQDLRHELHARDLLRDWNAGPPST